MILHQSFHTPVLLSEVLTAQRVEKGKKYIEATMGGGGYTDEILKLGGIVLGIDQDQDAIDFVRQKYQKPNSKYQINKDIFIERGNFKDLKEIALSKGFKQVAGIIFDLGMSSYQLEGSGRGFSYKYDEPLDMRMDTRVRLKALDLLNNYSKEKLYEIFTKYAEELHSRAIAEAVVRARSVNGDIIRTSTLSQLIDDVLGRIYSKAGKFNKLKIIQATKARIFQALRIEVNDELENLEKGLRQAIDLLGTGGKIAILSYHSLEDRCVKLIFKKEAQLGKLKILAKDFMRAEKYEIEENPRAKSAKLRIVEKVT